MFYAIHTCLLLFDSVMINDYVGGYLNATKEMLYHFLKCVGDNQRNTTLEKKKQYIKCIFLGEHV